jgi:hypothetical protein
VNDVALVVITAGIGVVTGAIATAYKSRKDLEVQYDIKLREERIAAYKELWKELDRLAYYSPPHALTCGVAKELAKALRTWYFEVGGLLMSTNTREPYFDLQRALKQITESGGEDHEEIADAAALKQLGSRLRTSTTDDVATRVRPLVRETLRARFERLRRPAKVTVTRGWSFGETTTGVWRVTVTNQWSTRPLTVRRVWFATRNEPDAMPLDAKKRLPVTLFPRESWQGFVPDEPGLTDGVENPFEAARASGPRWLAKSRPAGDPPASPIPGGSADAQQPGAAGDGERAAGRDLDP